MLFKFACVKTSSSPSFKQRKDFDVTKEIFEKVGILHCQVLKRGSYKELLEFPVENFHTTLPSLFNLPPLNDNIAEGIVIKPVKTSYYKGTRVILKKKSSRFSEKASKQPKRKREGEEKNQVEEHVSLLAEEGLRYVNKNRLASVVSKEEALKEKDRNRIIGLLVKDSLEDFLKEWSEQYDVLGKKKKSFVKGKMMSAATQVVLEHWSEFCS